MHITVISYNIRMGTYNPLGLEGIARLIEQQRPDVIGLQEVNVYGYPSGPVDQPQWLAERLSMSAAFGPTRQFPERVHPEQAGWTGNALLSRFPIAAVAVEPLPLGLETPYRGTVLAVALNTPYGPLHVFVTHWSSDVVPHLAQAQATVQFAQSWRPGPPIVLLGDFNALPDSPALALVREAFADAWQFSAAAPEEQVSYPSGPPGSTTPDGWCGPLDYIFVGPGLSVSAIRVVHDETRASDHNPVLAQLRLYGAG